MQRMVAATALSFVRSHLAHRARAFKRPPDAEKAAMLLKELATALCAYSPVAADVPLALYGAGNMGRLARDFLATVGRKPVMVIDRDARRFAQEPSWSGERLVHPDQAAEFAKDGLRIAVCVVTAPYVPIERSLQQLGFDDIVPFYDLAESFRGVHPLSNGWFAAPLTAFDREKTAEVLARWDDDVSRAHHLQFLAWRRLREEWIFDAAPTLDCARFFIPEVARVLNDDEFLLDAGAHDGSVSQAFVQYTKGAFRRIAAIEPDPSNRARLEVNLQSWLPDDPRVTVYDCALDADDGKALFHDGLDYASQLSGTGSRRITTRPLDALCLSPSFVKFHLEGAELRALKGARQTLLGCRPLVAATVYHNDDGIWKTALWMMETFTDYRFLFRAHSWCGTGAVIYAIPNERRGSNGRTG
jgi:FkbM family methyltransferase